MKPIRSLSLVGTLLALFATTLVLAGSAAVLPPKAEAQTSECTATGATLDEAKDAYASACDAPRVDCDPTDSGWTCSSGIIGAAAPGGLTAPEPTPDAPTPEPTPTAAPRPETPETDPAPTPSSGAGDCLATGPTLDQAKAEYLAACNTPRTDCDQIDGSWTCSSGVIGAAAPGGATPSDSDPTPPANPGADGCNANTTGIADLTQDLISLHYDHAPDRDDGHATAAGKEVATDLGFIPWVIGGAYGADNGNSYRASSEVVMDAVWGPGNWVNADANWDAAVQQTADRWQTALQECGDIWIAEGGQSDLSADVVRELRERLPDLDTNARIHLVQHSQWNEDQALDADLAYVKRTTDYRRIPDGNGAGNGTAGLNQQNYSGPFITSALNGPHALGWAAAFDYYPPQDRLDFSDTVELLSIVGIGTGQVNDIEDFADRFMRSANSGSGDETSADDAELDSESDPADSDAPSTDDGSADEVSEPTATGPDAPSADAPNGEIIERTYAATDGPDDNPMKGWNSGWSDDRPEASVGFQYIKWSDFEPSNGTFDFEAVESIINRSGSRNRHVILRLYCDWWGQDETSRGCPDWIYSDVGVDRIQGDNGRYITDYNDPRYVDEAVQAIEALASRYDDDPRLYSFQLGVIGYWGEWHTWGSQVDGSPYEISETTQQRIIDAYLNSFDRVPVMGRQPWGDTLSATTGIGFHNDYFRPNNGHSADFDAAIASNSFWQSGPIGGEMPPGLNAGDYFDLYETQQGLQMIETGGYSTMKPTSGAGQGTDGYLTMHRRFGYNYQIENARYSAASPQGGQTNVAVSVRNVGIAPLYYSWQVQFALIDDTGTPAATADAAPYDLRNAGPGQSFTLAGALSLDGIAAGDYSLAVRILQPGADRAKPAPWGLDARTTYILFANDVPVIDGSWDSSNALSGGWSILGSTAVE